MKKFIICSLQLLFVLLAATSCNDDEKQIDYEMLPERARQFIQLYFPTEQCVRVVLDKDDGKTEYDAWLNNGTELEFDKRGEWISVDCRFSAVPAGILPEAITADIATRYPNAVVFKAEKQLSGYEIDIAGWDLYYNQQGAFIFAKPDWD